MTPFPFPLSAKQHQTLLSTQHHRPGGPSMQSNKETALDPERNPTGEGEVRTSNDHDMLIDEAADASSHISGMKLYLIVLSLLLAVFCVALDNTVRSPGAVLPLSWHGGF